MKPAVAAPPIPADLTPRETDLAPREADAPPGRRWWPPGTTLFALKTWIALAIGFYASFFLQLEGASTCGVSILILAQPTQGMVLSKAIYRTAGTLVGVVAALILSALFPQDRTMLVAGFAVWLGAMTAVATLLRDFRAYGCVLAGYTVAIVSVTNIDAPATTFEAAINRVAAILVGVAAITLANVLLGGDNGFVTLRKKLRVATLDVVALAQAVMADRRRPTVKTCVTLAARLVPLRSEIGFAAPEKAGGPARIAGARGALLGLLEAIAAIEAVGVGLENVAAPGPTLTQALDLTRQVIARQQPERALPSLDGLTSRALQAGTLRIEEAHLLDRLRFLVTTLGEVRDGLRAMRTGRPPRRRVTLPVHQDYLAVLLNALRVMVAVAVVAVLSVWSGIPNTATAVLFTGVFVSLGSLQPDPRALGNAGLFGMPAVVVLSTIYSFFVFPNLDGYPLFILSLAPLVVLTCWLVMLGQPGYGLIIGVLTMAQIAPANVQTIDPAGFVASATMLVPSGIAIFVAFRLVLPVQPGQRRLRLALGTGRMLRNALADRDGREQPRASVHFDRLSQFKTWQRDDAVTLARRKALKRLIDVGMLAHAVRRSWRALDRARALVPAELDARARQVLPSLEPRATEAVARDFLDRAAELDAPGALAVVHAAAALYGTALATNDEARLLRRVELLGRTP